MNTDLATRTILLADDDPDDAEIFSMVLTKVDPSIKLIHAPNGVAVLEYLKERNHVVPDVIFLDINMPEMNGWQCLQSLKANPLTSGIPVLMYTTSSQARDKEIAMNLGAVAFITKPSDYKTLEKLLLSIATNLNANIKTTASTLR
jgi:CheY-like chemotaxis protein